MILIISLKKNKKKTLSDKSSNFLDKPKIVPGALALNFLSE